MLWRRIHRYTLQEPADMLHGRIQRHLKQQGSQRIHQTQQGENFYISRMEVSLVWLLIRRRIHLIKRYHRIQRNRIQKIVLLAQQEFFSNGLTSVQDAGSPEEWVEAWQELYEKERLKLRIYVSMRVLGRPNYQELMEGSLKFFKKGLRIGMYDNRLTARAYKISLDGSLGARSAWMLEDYEDQPGHKGNGKWTNDQLYSVLYEARRLVSRPGAMQLEMQLTVSVWMYMNSF